MKRLLSLIITILIVQHSVNAQQNEDNIKTALLIVDIQNFYFPGDGPGLVNAVPASLNAKEVLKVFRDESQVVVHVRHQTEKGFEIHENVQPISGEKVITKHEINSFNGTDLFEYLKSQKINRLIIIGMQTQMCVEAAIRASHDFGFECVVIEDACATRDVTYGDRTVKAEDVQTCVLATVVDGGYSKVIDLNTFKGNVDKYLFQKLD